MFAWSDPPIEGESFRGFVARNAAKHGIRKLSTALKGAGISTLRPENLATVQFERAAELAETFRTSEAEVASRFYRPLSNPDGPDDLCSFFGVPLRTVYLEKKRRRVSPRSLRTSPHHRALWDLRPFQFCPESKEPLIDTCPSCQAALGWRWTRGVHICETCEVDLRDFPKPVIEIEDEFMLDTIVDLVRPGVARSIPFWRSGHPEFPDPGLTFGFAVALAWAFSDIGASSGPRRLGEAKDFAAILPSGYVEAARLLEDWDTRIEGVVSRFARLTGERSGNWGLKKELGRLADVADDPYVAPEFRTLLKETGIARLSTLNGGAVRRAEWRTGADWITVCDAAKRCLANRTTLMRWRTEGLLKTMTSPGAKRSIVLVDRSQLEEILKDKDAVMRASEVSALLGIDEKAVAGLSAEGLIRRVDGPVASLHRGADVYQRLDVQALVEQMRSLSRPHPEGDVVPLVEAMGKHPLGFDLLPNVISAALRGELNLYLSANSSRPLVPSLLLRPGTRLSALPESVSLFDVDDLPTGMTINEAAGYLKVGRPTVSDLIREDFIRQNERTRQRLDRWRVVEFRNSYMLTMELAGLLDCSQNVVVQRMKAHSVEPLHKLGGRGRYLWSRPAVHEALGLPVRQVPWSGPGVHFFDKDTSLSVHVPWQTLDMLAPDYDGSQGLRILERHRETLTRVASLKARRRKPWADRVRVDPDDLGFLLARPDTRLDEIEKQSPSG